MTPDEQIAYVEKQMRAVERGATDTINCPYCKSQLRQEDGRICCLTMGKAVQAILRRWASKDVLDNAARVCEAAQRN